MINGKNFYGVIIPDDVCSPDVCGGGVGAMIGDIYTPTFALDQAGGSSAFKMVPTADDILEMLTGVIQHFKWTDFIFLYDSDPGWYDDSYSSDLWLLHTLLLILSQVYVRTHIRAPH